MIEAIPNDPPMFVHAAIYRAFENSGFRRLPQWVKGVPIDGFNAKSPITRGGFTKVRA